MSIGKIGHVFLRRSVVEKDWKLARAGKNNGRKHFVNELFPATEKPIEDPEWSPGPEGGPTPVVVTGVGGLEIATFTGEAAQDRHKHHASTEIYTVLEGTLRILIEDEGPFELVSGDEVVVLPGTVHEILRPPAAGGGPPLLVRVHALDCRGASDKFVQLAPGGEWVCWLDAGARSVYSPYRTNGR